MSYREKRALITLLALWVVVIGFVASELRNTPASVHAAMPGMARAVILLIGILIVSHISLVIGVGRKEARQPSDERERLIGLVSRRNAGWIGQVGLWLVLLLAVMASPHMIIANAALGAFVLAEIVMYASELYYYRRGV